MNNRFVRQAMISSSMNILDDLFQLIVLMLKYSIEHSRPIPIPGELENSLRTLKKVCLSLDVATGVEVMHYANQYVGSLYARDGRINPDGVTALHRAAFLTRKLLDDLQSKPEREGIGREFEEEAMTIIADFVLMERDVIEPRNGHAAGMGNGKH